jgi:hypothetical protein
LSNFRAEASGRLGVRSEAIKNGTQCRTSPVRLVTDEPTTIQKLLASPNAR